MGGAPARGFAFPQSRQPVVGAAHLPTVGRVAEARQPGAVVRRADGDHMLDGIGRRATRNPHGQPLHAVRHHQRRAAGGFAHARHRGVDDTDVVADAAEHRLEVPPRRAHRPGGSAAARGFQKPRLQTKPCTSTTPKRLPAPAGRWSGSACSGTAGASRTRAALTATSPHRARSSCAKLARRRIGPRTRASSEFEREHERVAEQDQQRPATVCPSGRRCRTRRPGQRNGEQRERGELLQAGKASCAGSGISTTSRPAEPLRSQLAEPVDDAVDRQLRIGADAGREDREPSCTERLAICQCACHRAAPRLALVAGSCRSRPSRGR